MISINTMTSGGFGNKILYYNNLRQLAARENEEWSCVPWEGSQIFNGDLLNGSQSGDSSLNLCLGERFFEWRTVPTRTIFELKQKPIVEPNSAAIHFRGTDFFQWNSDAVLDAEYYLNAIEEVPAETFYLFTDDKELQSYKSVVKYLEEKSKNIVNGVNTSNRQYYIGDFSVMSECDYIISSPSTYCICAGFIGKNKKIIHCNSWVSDRVSKEDKFWVDLNNGGNEDYSLWRLI